MSDERNDGQEIPADASRYSGSNVGGQDDGHSDVVSALQIEDHAFWQLRLIVDVNGGDDGRVDLKKYEDIDDIFKLDDSDYHLANHVTLFQNKRLNFFVSPRDAERHLDSLNAGIAGDNVGNSVPDEPYGPEVTSTLSMQDEHERLYRLVALDVCRSFLAEICVKLHERKVKRYDALLQELSAMCLASLEMYDDRHVKSVHEFRNMVRRYLTSAILQTVNIQSSGQEMADENMSMSLNGNSFVMQCLLRACPYDDEDEVPAAAFSVEEVGRDGWMLTTYGEKPMRRVLRPYLAMRVPIGTHLQLNVQLVCTHAPVCKLRML